MDTPQVKSKPSETIPDLIIEIRRRVHNARRRDRMIHWIVVEGFADDLETLVLLIIAKHKPIEHKPILEEEHAFMLGGELAFYNVVDGAVLLYGNAIEPWGVHVHVDPVDIDAVEQVARRLFRKQNPDLPFE